MLETHYGNVFLICYPDSWSAFVGALALSGPQGKNNKRNIFSRLLKM